jgi:hypothetical protein
MAKAESHLAAQEIFLSSMNISEILFYYENKKVY